MNGRIPCSGIEMSLKFTKDGHKFLDYLKASVAVGHGIEEYLQMVPVLLKGFYWAESSYCKFSVSYCKEKLKMGKMCQETLKTTA